MWDIAEEFNAMVVFAEHRFYGSSFPNNFSYTFPDVSHVLIRSYMYYAEKSTTTNVITNCNF